MESRVIYGYVARVWVRWYDEDNKWHLDKEDILVDVSEVPNFWGRVDYDKAKELMARYIRIKAIQIAKQATVRHFNTTKMKTKEVEIFRL